MEAGISMVMANMAQIQKNHFVCDPFVGTGVYESWGWGYMLVEGGAGEGVLQGDSQGQRALRRCNNLRK